MKKIFLIAVMCSASMSLMAQGRVSLGNINAGAAIDAPVRDFGALVVADSTGTHSTPAGTGTPLGSLYKAQLYWSDLDVPLGVGFTAATNNPATFQDALPGYISAATKILPRAGGATVFVQMRAWKLADGATYEAALAAGGTVGFSRTVSVVLTLSPTASAPMAGLTSFEVGTVPEPSTIALGVVGLLGAFFIRRRK